MPSFLPPPFLRTFFSRVNSASINYTNKPQILQAIARNHSHIHRRVWKRSTKHREIENLTRSNHRHWINLTRWTLPLNRNESHIHYSYSSLNTAINSWYLSSPPLKFKAAVIFAAGTQSNGPRHFHTDAHAHKYTYFHSRSIHSSLEYRVSF